MTKRSKGIHSNFEWFEDFKVGQVFEYGHWVMQKQDMLDYARMYDPEPFHVDEEAAIQLGWGGIIASGPQIVSICRRLQTDGFPNARIVISPGWDEIRWFKPVYANDILTCHTEILGARELKSRPNEGSLEKLNQILNQEGEVSVVI